MDLAINDTVSIGMNSLLADLGSGKLEIVSQRIVTIRDVTRRRGGQTGNIDTGIMIVFIVGIEGLDTAESAVVIETGISDIVDVNITKCVRLNTLQSQTDNTLGFVLHNILIQRNRIARSRTDIAD